MSYYEFLDVADNLLMDGFIIDHVSRHEFEATRSGVTTRVIRGNHGVDLLSYTGESAFAIPACGVASWLNGRAA